MEALQGLIFMALVVEFLTAVFKNLISDRYTQIVSVSIGILLCTVYQLGIFSAMGLETNFLIVDYVLSGVIVSRGSNAVYELVGKRAREARAQRKR